MTQWTRYQVAEFEKPLERVVTDPPVPTGTEVLVETLACGVCHSDVHLRDGFFDLGGGRKTPSIPAASMPLTPGHEIVGKVVALGPDAKGVAIGDSRIVYPWIGCGESTCAFCARGEEQICAKRSLGANRNGGFATHVLVPDALYLIDYGSIPTVTAGTYACSGLTAYGALEKVGQVGPKENVVIIGAGGLGMFALRIAKQVTGARLVVADIDAAKRQAALENGADEVLDPTDADSAKRFMKATGGAIAAIDFVGGESTVKFGMATIRRGARLVIVGLFGGSLTIPIPFFPFLSLTIQGSYVGSLDDLRDLVALGQTGAIGPVPHVVRPLAEANAALDDLQAGKVVGRVILRP